MRAKQFKNAEFDRSWDLVSPFDERLVDSRFDPKHAPPDEPIIFSISGVTCSTPRNISALTPQRKTGKIALLSAIIFEPGACLCGPKRTLTGVPAQQAGFQDVISGGELWPPFHPHYESPG